MALVFPPGQQFFDSNGRPVASGSLTFFDSGTTNLKPVYTDSAMTIVSANPVSLDASGRLPINLFGMGSYTIVLKLAAGAVVWSRDASNVGFDLPMFIQDGAGAVERDIVEKQKEIVSVKDFGAVGDGVTDDTAAFQSAVAYSVLLPAGGYNVVGSITASAPLAVTADLQATIGGNGSDLFATTGDATLIGVSLDGANRMLSLSGTESARLMLRDVQLSNSAGHFVRSDTSEAPDVAFLIDNAQSKDTRGLVDIAGAGTLTGTVVNGSADGVDRLGVRLGWNNRTLAANWGPVSVVNTVIRNVEQDDAFSMYGIISYSPYSRIIGNHVENVYNAGSGGDTEGIYTKAPHSVVANNVLKDAGQTEGFLNIKGVSKDPDSGSGPFGHNLVAVGNVFECTAAYRALASASAVKISTENVLFSAAVIDGFNSKGIDTAGGQPLHNLRIADVIIDNHQGTNAAAHPAIALSPSFAKNCALSGLTIANVPSVPAIAVVSGDTSVDYLISDFAIRDVFQGFRIASNNDSTLILRNGKIIGATNAAITGAGTSVFKRLLIEDVYFENCAALFTSNRLVKHFEMSRCRWVGFQTTERVTTTAFTAPVARDGITIYTIVVKGSSGSEQFIQEIREVWSNAAGTVTLIGSRENLFTYASAGATSGAWAVQASVAATNGVSFRVIGEASTTISWEFEITARTVNA